jgi:putative flippase GtrA
MLQDTELVIKANEVVSGEPTRPAQMPWLVAFLVGLPIIRNTALARRPKEFERFLKFATVGVIGMVVDFGILNLLVQVFHLPVLVANIFSFSAAVVSNFTWNRLWTFPESRQRPLFRQLGQFAIVNVVGLLINEVVLFVVLQAIQAVVPSPLNYNLAKAFAIGVVLFWNYFVNRLWTYKGIE